MFTQWANIIFRKFISFINISADLTYKAFLAFCLWLWFDVVLVVGVGHGLLVTHDAGFGDTADKHSVSSQIYVLLYFQGHECIDIFIQEHQSVAGTVDFLACEFVSSSAGLETESFENRERCFDGQAVYIQDSSLLDHMM